MEDRLAGRRRFLGWVAREGVAFLDELGGRPQLSFSDLPGLPDDVVALLVPVVAPGVEIFVEDGLVGARLPDRETSVPLFRPDGAVTLVFNGFNGQSTLGEIARQLSLETSWPPERSFGAVRDFFLHLVRLGVCVPANYVR